MSDQENLPGPDEDDGGASALEEDLAAVHDDPEADEPGDTCTVGTGPARRRPVGGPSDRLLRLLAGSSETEVLRTRPGSEAGWFLLTLAGVARAAALPEASRARQREVVKMAVCTGLSPVGTGTLDTEVLNATSLLTAGYMVLRHPDCGPDYAVQLASLDTWMQALVFARPGTLITDHKHLRAWLEAQRKPWEVHKYLAAAGRTLVCDNRPFNLPHQITEVYTTQILTSARLRGVAGTPADDAVTAAGSILLAEALTGPRSVALTEFDTAPWCAVADTLGTVFLDLCERVRRIVHAPATVDLWDNAEFTSIVTHAATATDAAMAQIQAAVTADTAADDQSQEPRAITATA